MVSGLVLTSSDWSIRSELATDAPASFTTNGLGSTAPRTVSVPGVSPLGVFGLQPVGLWAMPKEMAPPATPTYVTVVLPPLLPPQAAARIPMPATSPTSLYQRRGRRPRRVTAAGDPG